MKVPIHPNEEGRSWAVSLSFWGCLLLSAVLYASVALSPKVVNYIRLRTDFNATQFELVELEREVQYLARVAEALERPDFSEELARVDFDASRPGDERIRVNPTGTPINREALDASVPEETVSRPAIAYPWYMPLIDMLATDMKLRRSLLIASSVVVLVAFTFLQEGSRRRKPSRKTLKPSAEGPRWTNRLADWGAAISARYASPK